MKENILLVGPYPPIAGGGETQLDIISKLLNKLGYGVFVLTMGIDRNLEIKNDDGIKIYRIGKFKRNRRGTVKLFEILKYITIEIFNPLLFILTIYLILKNRIKTVHLISYNQFSLSPLIASKILMRNIVVGMHAHELLCSYSTIMPFCLGIRRGRCGDCMSRCHKYPKGIKKFEWLLSGFYNLFSNSIPFLKLDMTNHLADTIVFPSEHSKNLHLAYGVKKEKAKVIPPFLDYTERTHVDSFVKNFKSNGKRVILYVGKTEEEKGIRILLLSLREVLKSNKKWILLVAGHGRSFEEMKDLARELKIYKHVKFLGGVPHSDIFSYYNISDIVVIPSIVPETFSIALTEASLSKKILICSKIGALEERIRDGENGFLVEPENPEELAKKIIFVLNNYRELKGMGERAYEDIKSKYDSPKSLLKYIKIFDGD